MSWWEKALGWFRRRRKVHPSADVFPSDRTFPG